VLGVAREGTGSPTADAAMIDGPSADADPNALTPDELAAIAKLSPLPAVPADPTNAYADNAAAAALGQMLFFDKSYSGALAVGTDSDASALGARLLADTSK
jgi:cytochrome c peroxidase